MLIDPLYLYAQAGNVYPACSLVVSAKAYQPWYSIFLSQQTSTSQAYQPRNQPASRLMLSKSLLNAIYIKVAVIFVQKEEKYSGLCIIV